MPLFLFLYLFFYLSISFSFHLSLSLSLFLFVSIQLDRKEFARYIRKIFSIHACSISFCFLTLSVFLSLCFSLSVSLSVVCLSFSICLSVYRKYCVFSDFFLFLPCLYYSGMFYVTFKNFIFTKLNVSITKHLFF
jgi:hypothetical protein